MEFRQNYSRQKKFIRLQFYDEPPTEEISLEEVESLAVERLKILKCVESASQDFARGGGREYQERLTKNLEKASSRLGRIFTVPTNNQRGAADDIRLDIISHYILQVAYCRSEDLRRWLIRQEVDLFNYRFNLEKTNDIDNSQIIQQFLQMNNLKFLSVDESEISEIQDKLATGTMALSTSGIAGVTFYKVPFTDVLDLVKKRRVFLKMGFAFVPDVDILSLVSARFRENLSKHLSLMSRSLPNLEEDTRVLPMLSALSKRYLGEQYGNKQAVNGAIMADQVDQLANISFPPCMQQLHNGLRRDSHLRHGGRMQYGLFLKGIGLPMEENLKFWRSGFQAKIDSEKFEKQYSYNIRHMYGKEGKRVSYSPYSCVKIITTNMPGPADNHGCPFRHTDTEILKQRLKALKIGTTALEEIMRYRQENQYQLSCREFFKEVHGGGEGLEVGINHPNQYFDDSQKIVSGKKVPVEKTVPSRVFKVKNNVGDASEWWEDGMDAELSQVDDSVDMS